jgi:hypothetical protein
MQSDLMATWWDEAMVFAVHNGCHQKVLEDMQDLAGHNVTTALGIALRGSSEDVVSHPQLQASCIPGDAQMAECRAVSWLGGIHLFNQESFSIHPQGHLQVQWVL